MENPEGKRKHDSTRKVCQDKFKFKIRHDCQTLGPGDITMGVSVVPVDTE